MNYYIAEILLEGLTEGQKYMMGIIIAMVIEIIGRRDPEYLAEKAKNLVNFQVEHYKGRFFGKVM